jgi:hypothetical protein
LHGAALLWQGEKAMTHETNRMGRCTCRQRALAGGLPAFDSVERQ